MCSGSIRGSAMSLSCCWRWRCDGGWSILARWPSAGGGSGALPERRVSTGLDKGLCHQKRRLSSVQGKRSLRTAALNVQYRAERLRGYLLVVSVWLVGQLADPKVTSVVPCSSCRGRSRDSWRSRFRSKRQLWSEIGRAVCMGQRMSGFFDCVLRTLLRMTGSSKVAEA